MSGQPKNLERGILGGSVILDVIFRQYPNGPLVDDDRYASTGQLPVVEIRNPSGILVESSTDLNGTLPIRTTTGTYSFTRQIGLDDEVSERWTITWKIQIEGNAVEFTEYFSVTEAGSAQFGEEEYRVGFAFNNPDLTSSHHADNWGLLLTPDEMRYIVMFGTKLTSPDANQTYDDNMLQYYIDNAIYMLERDLGISLFPKIVRYRDPINVITGEVEPRTAPSRVPTSHSAQ